MNPKILPSNPILLVDDEEHFLLSAELTLSSNGIKNIETCKDSSQVMDLLEKKEYSLVVLDINMPHLSGFDLLPAIVKDHPGIPVIVITAVNERLKKQHIKLSYSGGFNQYVLNMVIDFYDVKGNTKYAYEHVIGRQRSFTYSQQFIDFILKEIEKNPKGFVDSLKKSCK